ncbi:MAG: glutamate--tRNA ligase [Alphaproteobacteria bacterium]|nr:glutamate--tRNA ligase [Alphaproteobacteria bacterium]
MPNVITRFAPSPTGYLHIGGARTALFNWLYAKHTGGKFLLRIEDTDRERSTPEATQAILDGLKWLGLDWDGEPFYQFARAARHREVAEELLKKGEAYHCYTTPAELDEFRKANPNAKFKSPWRDGGIPPAGIKPSIRIKAPLEGSITVDDGIRGSVSVEAKEMDDMVLLRSDGTPTYMLAVVVDDHDMGVTQVIRGDDHFTNTFRQLMIYQAMGWTPPAFAHVPLIHGPDGTKLSKRHGALGVEAYREMGYLPEALRNYLLRLGWAHGDDEIISTEQAIRWFDLSGCGKSPARFDFVKLENLNGHYIREADDARLMDLISAYHPRENVDLAIKNRLQRGMAGLKQRAKTIKELADNAAFYAAKRPIALDAKATELLDKGGRELIKDLLPQLEASSDFSHEATMALCKAYGEKVGKKLGDIAQPLRAALSGKLVSPGVFEVMEILGKEESLGRLRDVLN